MERQRTAQNRAKSPSNAKQSSGTSKEATKPPRSVAIAPVATDADATPEGLRPATATWFTEVREEYSLDDPAGLYLLETAARAWDRAQEARKAIEKDGLRVKDRFKQWKAHPLCTVERDALATFRAALKDLNLDLEPLRDRPGRPPGV